MDHVLRELQAALPERYTLDSEIARTAMSRVYIAREKHPDRAVVVKVLENSLTAQLGRERFLREIDLMSGLSHPHIVPIFSAGDAEGALYYVMPFIAGETLSARLEREGRLPIDQAVRITLEVAEALHYAHGKDIIHRDIKPNNILFHEGHALVADFGIARVLSLADQGSLTQTGHSIGTPDYMSPEQVSPHEVLDARTDMYSLACLLFEMLVGEPPFRSSTARATMARHLAEDPGSIRARRRSVHQEIDGVVQRALQKAPEDRFDSMEEFGLALADAASMASAAGGFGTTSSTHPQLGWGQATTRWARGVITAFLVVAAAGVAWQAWGGGGVRLAGGPGVYTDSVAVMPFENLTGDPEIDGHGLADAITGLLTQVEEIKVVAHYSAETLGAGGSSILQLIDDLGVRHLLQGSIELENDRVIVTTWHGEEDPDARETRTYSGAGGDWFASEARIANEIVEDFLAEIDVSADGILGSLRGVGSEATLLGDHWLDTRTAEGVREAIAKYEEALGLDPTYAPAYSGLSSAYALAVTYRYKVGVGAYDAAGSSLAYANRAIQLDSTLAAGYAARGYILMLSDAPLPDAEAAFARAGELKPGGASIASWYSRVLARQGDLAGALAAARRAVSLDPAHSGRKLGVALRALQAGEYDEALTETSEVIDLAPSLMLTRALQGRALLLAGRSSDCLDIPLGPHAAIRAMCLHAQGEEGAAAAIVDSVSSVVEDEEEGPEHQLTHVARAEDLATYYAWIGDPVQSMQWVIEAYARSPTGIEPNVLGSVLFDAVRDDQNFSVALDGVRSQIWERVQAARDNAELAVVQ